MVDRLRSPSLHRAPDLAARISPSGDQLARTNEPGFTTQPSGSGELSGQPDNDHNLNAAGKAAYLESPGLECPVTRHQLPDPSQAVTHARATIW